MLFFGKGDWLDRLYPAPPEWNWITRLYWRNAKHEEEVEGPERGLTDWASVGTSYGSAVGFAEELRLWRAFPSGIELQDDWDRSIPGLSEELMRSEPEKIKKNHIWKSRIGYDITMKSEAWRRGYYEAMMGLCRCAEKRADYWTSTKTKMTYPPEHVRGPDNPHPKPLPPNAPFEIPDQEDCHHTLESADFHYVRLLTTKGFNRKQRMDAGLAFANWLDQKGDPKLAEAMFSWSMSLALRGVPNAERLIDPRTGVIKPNAPYITPNILSCSTALGTFQAQHDNIPAALNIFLSVLRARLSSPVAPRLRQYPPRGPDLSLSNVDSWIRWILSMPWAPEMPPPPPSGDEPFERRMQDACDEAALMAYVGEILFARTSRRSEGLAWTRDAADIADHGRVDGQLTDKGRRKCDQCLHTSLSNWHMMIGQLAWEKEELEKGQHPHKLDWSSTKESQSSPAMAAAAAGGIVPGDLRPVGSGVSRSNNVSSTSKSQETPSESSPSSMSSSWLPEWVRKSPSQRRDEEWLLQSDWATEAKVVHARLAEYEEQVLQERLVRMIKSNGMWNGAIA